MSWTKPVGIVAAFSVGVLASSTGFLQKSKTASDALDSITRFIFATNSKDQSLNLRSEQIRLHELSDYQRFVKRSDFSPTGNTIHSFGPNGTVVTVVRADSSQQRYATCTAPGSLILSKLNQGKNAVRAYAISAHGDEFISYRDENIEQDVWMLQTSSQRSAQAPSYNSLLRWLGKNFVPASTFVVFGPQASYFARNNVDCTWHDIPAKLEKVILEKREAYASQSATQKASASSTPSSDFDDQPDASSTESLTNDPSSKSESAFLEDESGWIPRIVALGPSNNYVAVWNDGRIISSLPADLPFIEALGSGPSALDSGVWENIVLSPHNDKHYFIALRSGHTIVNYDTDDAAHPQALTDTIAHYLQWRAKEDGSSFDVVTTANGKANRVQITSETNYPGTN